MKIRLLRSFVVLAEVRNFRRAAARLDLSQAALSRQMASLERAVGVALLERSPRGTELTPAGRQLCADAMSILASLERATAGVRLIASGKAGMPGQISACDSGYPSSPEPTARHARHGSRTAGAKRI
ncbi:LysR family transcriptional regulator [Paraburkholderia solisilvae]|uniref:HTH-type transcriptional regulator TfdS n=1 Tax=Paraburkholderia solisilvae TaxID=624376 RepID=A0A6J5ELW1_9BURK|nr:LysR family transcriptional regulator [Paraburkholderia solisilvae]CAB3766667.1 HTH-type transcriptional regulator TfdS [Paraburkholderia solisilvae]